MLPVSRSILMSRPPHIRTRWPSAPTVVGPGWTCRRRYQSVISGMMFLGVIIYPRSPGRENGFQVRSGGCHHEIPGIAGEVLSTSRAFSFRAVSPVMMTAPVEI